MLRYVERVGLLEAQRSAAGYRLYGPAELQRLRTLRELLDAHDIGLSDLAFALRLRRDGGLRQATDAWIESEPSVPPTSRRPAGCASSRRSTSGCSPPGAPHRNPHPGDCMTATTHARPTTRSPTSAWPPSAARRSGSPSTRCPA